MPTQPLKFNPGINKERTPHANELTWSDGDKVRFRQGFPEKIGGWVAISTNTFLGVCRALHTWVTLGGNKYTGVGTHLKYYIEEGGGYYDITPLRATESLTDPFDTTAGSAQVVVTDAAGGIKSGDFVTFSGASAVGGITVDGEYQVTISGTATTTYTITTTTTATSTTTGGGSVSAAYQINVGSDASVPLVGYGAGTYGSGTWGASATTANIIRIWSHANFGEDLIFCPRGGAIYYWDATAGTSTRAVELSTLGGASGVPTACNVVFVSDVSRFVFAMGTTPLGGGDLDPLLIRWSDQESAVEWTPAGTNQAGDIRLSRGTEIIAAAQSRQELLVWTDAALYSLQYVNPPIVWGTSLVGENVSIVSQNAVAYAAGRAFWMGKDKFYQYAGRAETLPCDVRRYVFNDLNVEQLSQIFAGTVEAFHEVWWFYCSSATDTVDRYVVHNYVENIWYHGTLARTAWLDVGTNDFPVGATYNGILVNHEQGADDDETGTPAPITAYIESGQFDMGDGGAVMLINSMNPDITFEGSTADNPAVTMTLTPMADSGAGDKSPASEGGNSSGTVTRAASSPVEAYTDTLYLRVRGRQMKLKIASTAEGVQWQLGVPYVDMRADGGRA